MSTVAELWNRLEDDEKTLLFKAAEHFLPERGGDLIRALNEHAQTHTEAFPYVPPPETVPALPDGHQLLPWVTEENGGKRVDWLHPDAYRDRLLHRRRGPEVDGGRLQAFPTPMPIQEEP